MKKVIFTIGKRVSTFISIKVLKFRTKELCYAATLILCLSNGAKAQVITTIAGTGTSGFSGDGGAATAAQFSGPYGEVAFDISGNYYIADRNNQRVRKVTPSGVISTFAGNGTVGYSGDGGQATNASLNYPWGLAFDAAGNLYIGHEADGVIRKVTTAGIISTVAGTGTSGFSGDGGAATAAQLNNPYGIALDPLGNLFICDVLNQRIRMVNTSGVITTVVGIGTAGFTGDGGICTAAELSSPEGIAFDPAGNIYIADAGNNRIRMVNASTGIINTFAGNGTAGFLGDGGAATAAYLNAPSGVAIDAAGNAYIADMLNKRIRMVNTAGVINTFAGNGTLGYTGDGGPATAAELNYSYEIAVDAAGNLYISDEGNNVIRFVCNSGLSVTVSSATVCAGSPATLTASGASTYTWNTGATGSSITVTPPVTTTYTVNGTNAGNCTNAGTSTVTVTPAVAVNSATVCAGGTATLTASGANTYLWNTGATMAAITASPTVTTSYTVTGTSGTCTSTATSIVTVNALPMVNAVSDSISLCMGNTATLTATGANTYTWSTSATTSTIAITPTVTTTYSVTGTDVNGCTNMATVTQTVITCSTGIERVAGSSNEVTVYPNPASTIINLKLKMQNGNTNLVITDMLGNTVKQSIISNPTSIISVADLAEGIYNVSISSNEGVVNKRLVIVR